MDLKAYLSPIEAELEIGNYIVFYNEQRNHQSLKALTPDEVYFSKRRFAALLDWSLKKSN